tara:strand:- start:3088 stop:3582 length:495 start_codon:yes stop_codon:yes gene_type:complete
MEENKLEEFESLLLNNIKDNYSKANKEKIYVENYEFEHIDVFMKDSNSVYIWDCDDCVIELKDRVNHIFVYNCDKCVIRVEDCVSGITCMKCYNTKILLKKTPIYNIEISNSYNMIIRSMFYNMPIMYKGVDMSVVKSIDCQVYEYYKINDGLLTNWNYNFFNF